MARNQRSGYSTLLYVHDARGGLFAARGMDADVGGELGVRLK